MGSLIIFFGSAVTAFAASIAILVLHGGWDAIAAGVVFTSGIAFVVAAGALLAEGEHFAPWR
jgi:hypothetical protein